MLSTRTSSPICLSSVRASLLLTSKQKVESDIRRSRDLRTSCTYRRYHTYTILFVLTAMVAAHGRPVAVALIHHHLISITILIIIICISSTTVKFSDAYAAASSPLSTPNHKWSSSSTTLQSSSSSATTTSSETTAQNASASGDDENITTREILSLDYIRSTLIRQEETIIFALIERAQYRQNEIVYKVGGIPGLGVPPGSSSSSSSSISTTGVNGQDEELSFLDFMFIGTVRRIVIFLFTLCIVYEMYLTTISN